jgi:hypothetical protein
MMSWIVRHGFPPAFQTLCWSCNQGKHYGGCPHYFDRFYEAMFTAQAILNHHDVQLKIIWVDIERSAGSNLKAEADRKAIALSGAGRCVGVTFANVNKIGISAMIVELPS